MIEPYRHRCVVRSGDLAGNKNVVDVSAFDIEYATRCDECGEPLCTPAQAVAHLYGELVERVPL